MARAKGLLAVGIAFMVIGMVDLAREGSIGSAFIALGAVFIALSTRGDAPKNNGANDAR